MLKLPQLAQGGREATAAAAPQHARQVGSGLKIWGCVPAFIALGAARGLEEAHRKDGAAGAGHRAAPALGARSTGRRDIGGCRGAPL